MESELVSISANSDKIVSLSQGVLFGQNAISLTKPLSGLPGRILDPFLQELAAYAEDQEGGTPDAELRAQTWGVPSTSDSSSVPLQEQQQPRPGPSPGGPTFIPPAAGKPK